MRFSYAQVKKTADNATSQKVNQLALGYVHNLSKRTALYTSFSHVVNSNYNNAVAGSTGLGYGVAGASTTANGSINGIDIGIRMKF